MDRQAVNLNAVVTKLEPLLRQLVGDGVVLEVDVDPRLGSVAAPRDRLELLVTELTARARDQLPSGGHVILQTADVELDEARELHGESVPRGRYACVSVLVVRPDAEPKSRKQLSATTRGARASRELSTLVKACGGRLIFGSSENEPALQVLLPRLEDELAAADELNETKGRVSVAETILLADDEDPIREFARMILEKKGYRVLVAKNGAEAIRVAKSHSGPIHLMLADVVMPEVGGPEAAQELNQLRPEMRVLFISGYSDKVVPSQRGPTVGRAYLHKPFTMDSLLRTVRDALDSRSDPRDV